MMKLWTFKLLVLEDDPILCLSTFLSCDTLNWLFLWLTVPLNEDKWRPIVMKYNKRCYPWYLHTVPRLRTSVLDDKTIFLYFTELDYFQNVFLFHEMVELTTILKHWLEMMIKWRHGQKRKQICGKRNSR